MDNYVEFFYRNAGYSCKTGATVGEQLEARLSNAEDLATMEAMAKDRGFRAVWDIDRDMDSSEWSDEVPPWHTWNCTLWDYDENGQSALCATLCGIDFGRDGEPWGSDYARVIEAELAAEYFNDGYDTEEG